MSTGAFINSKYQASYQTPNPIHPIRIHPETTGITDGDGNVNDPPTGSITNPISAAVKLGAKSFGLKPRTITLQFPSSGQPSGYEANGTTVLPILVPSYWDLLVDGTFVEYRGSVCEVIGRSDERTL